MSKLFSKRKYIIEAEGNDLCRVSKQFKKRNVSLRLFAKMLKGCRNSGSMTLEWQRKLADFEWGSPMCHTLARKTPVLTVLC